jgi:transcriptional regulator with XRE-family HTH domain
MNLYVNDFPRIFSELLSKSGVTCYQISRYTGLDQAYLSRLKNGEKTNPSPETVVKICIAIAHFSDKLTIHDFDSLFRASGRSLFPKLKE